MEEHQPDGLASLAEAANREHAACEAAYASAVDHAIAAGEALLAAKAQVQYGQWLQWMDDHFHGSRRTAQVYMKMARNAEAAHLAGQSSIKQALEAIPEPDRVVVVDPPHTGDPEGNYEEPDLAEQKWMGAIVAEATAKPLWRRHPLGLLTVSDAAISKIKAAMKELFELAAEPRFADGDRTLIAELILGLSADLTALRAAFLNPESTRFDDEEARRLLGDEGGLSP